MTTDLVTLVRQRLAAEGISVSAWGNGPFERYAPHAHDHDKVLVTIEGSIVFRSTVPGEVHELRAGDRLDLPAGTVHAAEVGPDGVRCLEGHLPAGALGREARRVADWATRADGGRAAPQTDSG